MKQLSMALLAAAIAATASGCIVDVGPLPQRTGTQATAGAGTGRAPIIQALDYSPKSAVGKDDAITFTIVATDVEGDVLQYNWASTKGTLSANSGQVVSWKAAKADGSFDPGLTTVSVIISDGRSTTTGAINLMIDAQGQATVNGTTTAPAPAATAQPTATPAASPSPAASASPEAAASASPSPSPSASPADNTVVAPVQ